LSRQLEEALAMAKLCHDYHVQAGVPTTNLRSES